MKVIFAGGGTAGHVMPNIALLPYLREKGYEIHYIGGKGGIEQDILAGYPDVTYHAIDTGKLRRYHSTDNIKDVHIVFTPERSTDSAGNHSKTFLEGVGVQELPENKVEKDVQSGD